MDNVVYLFYTRTINGQSKAMYVERTYWHNTNTRTLLSILIDRIRRTISGFYRVVGRYIKSNLRLERPASSQYASLLTSITSSAILLKCTNIMTRLTVIVAATVQNGIGQNGKLPWHIHKDMNYFAQATTKAPEGTLNAVVMGRNTWESIPERFRPLKDRMNIVISRNNAYEL